MTQFTTCPRCNVRIRLNDGACCEWDGSPVVMCSTCACYSDRFNYWMSELKETPSTPAQKETNTEMTHCTNCGKTIDSANTTCFACSPFAECEFTLEENDEINVTESAVIGNDDPEMSENCPMCAAHPGKLCKLCAARERVSYTSTQKRPTVGTIYNMLLITTSNYNHFHARLQTVAHELYKTKKAQIKLINSVAALLADDRHKWRVDGVRRFTEYYGISGNLEETKNRAKNDIDYLVEQTVAYFPVLTEAFFQGVDHAYTQVIEAAQTHQQVYHIYWNGFYSTEVIDNTFSGATAQYLTLFGIGNLLDLTGIEIKDQNIYLTGPENLRNMSF